MPESPAASPILIVLRILFVLAVGAWHSALPWAIERQVIGAPLGPTAALSQDGGEDVEPVSGRAVSRVRWITGRGVYVATVDQKTSRLMEIEIEPLAGWHEVVTYLLVLAAVVLFLHLITSFLFRSKNPRYR